MLSRAAGTAAVVLATVVALSLLAGCSSSQAKNVETISLDGPWAGEFQKAYADAKSAWERDVLRDGVVTAAEYEQSRANVRASS